MEILKAKKSTRSKVLSVAKKHNINIDDTGMAIWYDCPDGYCLAGMPGIHYAHVYYEDERFTKGEAWYHVLTDIKNGIEKCECEDCCN